MSSSEMLLRPMTTKVLVGRISIPTPTMSNRNQGVIHCAARLPFCSELHQRSRQALMWQTASCSTNMFGQLNLFFAEEILINYWVHRTMTGKYSSISGEFLLYSASQSSNSFSELTLPTSSEWKQELLEANAIYWEREDHEENRRELAKLAKDALWAEQVALCCADKQWEIEKHIGICLLYQSTKPQCFTAADR